LRSSWAPERSTFDTSGQLLTTAPIQVTVDRAGTGAATPLTFDMEFASDSGAVTSLADTHSAIAAAFQDGSPLGTLASFSIGPDGVINGAFTNGVTRNLGTGGRRLYSRTRKG
jgi:flagellar hook protein FlgE